MSIREWLLAAGIVLIVGVLAHMVWEIWRRRRAASTLMPTASDAFDELDSNPELPNGGARVTRREVTDGFGSDPDSGLAPDPGTDPERPIRSEPETETAQAHHPDPLTPTTRPPERPRAEPPTVPPDVARPPRPADEAVEPRVPPPIVARRDDAIPPVGTSPPPAPVQQALLPEEDAVPTLVESVGGDDSGAISAGPSDRIGRRGRRSDAAATRSGATADPELVFVLHVVDRRAEAPDEGFEGPAIRHLAEDCGMRLGGMDVFHQYRTIKGSQIQYSMANGVAPGTFDLAALDTLRTPALTFFLQLPGPEQPVEAFEQMVHTARRFSRELDGDLLDENGIVCTQQSLEHLHQQVVEYRRKQLSRRD